MLYRVLLQGVPKTTDDGATEPSCMQETPDEGQIARPRMTGQPYSRRERNSLWGDITERNLRFSSDS